MTARKSTENGNAEGKRNDAVNAPRRGDESEYLATARAILNPDARHGMTAAQLFKAHLGDSGLAPGIGDYGDAFAEQGKKAASGDLTFASRMLASQALSLDSIFTEMARRSALNMGEYIEASERFMRLALKAQAGSRATLEALAKLHQPREQTVRHVHVNEGGQAVIADQFHHHTGGVENGQSNGQPHATGTGPAGTNPALSGPDSLGQAMPIPSREGQGAVPDARGQG